MKKSSKAILILSIILICIVLDQFTKSIAQQELLGITPISYLNGFFVFQYSENTGAMLGLGEQLPPHTRTWLLVILNGVVLAGMLLFIWLSKEMTPLSVTGGSLVVAGGIGNIIDRLANDGVVVDFMHFGIGSLRTGIFNVADVAIMVGMGLLILWSLMYREAEVDAAQE